MTKVKSTAGTDLPKMRYVDDYLRYIKTLNEEVDDIGKLVKQQQKLLAFLITKPVRVEASMVFNLNPSSSDEQRKAIRNIRTKINPDLTQVQVPGIKKLQSQYALAEDLYERFKLVENMEAQLSLQFPDRRGEAYEDAINGLTRLRVKISDHLKTILGYLNEVADKHVPKTFSKYVTALAETVEKCVVFKNSESFMYASVDDEGNLLFTNYLMLIDAINDKGEITPHLYVSVQLHLTSEPTLSIDLNHEYEVPNKLIGQGEKVGTVGEAARALNDMLSMESFSSALGLVPLALQLKVMPSKLEEMFVARDFVDRVTVDDHTITFRLRQEVSDPETASEVCYTLYKDIHALLKTKGVRLTMRKPEPDGKHRSVTFNIVQVAKSGEINHHDLEFLRERFGIGSVALSKIARIING